MVEKELMDKRIEMTPPERRSNATTAKERIEMCNGCEKKTERMGMPVCSDCGCFIYLKAHLKFSKCPLNKW